VLWDRQVERFAARHRVVRYDARGFGRSDEPHGEFAFHDDLRVVLDANGIERAALVGVSLGGRVLLDFALAFPERVTRLVPVNPGLSGYEFTGLAQYLGPARAARARGDLDAFVEVQLRMWFDGLRDPSAVDAGTREEVRRILVAQTVRSWSRADAPRLRELNAISRLADIRAPTLIVESALDRPDIHAICSLLEAGIPGARRIVIAGAAHLVNVERPDAFADAVLPFLDASPD
jgi:3-oxoadipate enol-lactonase